MSVMHASTSADVNEFMDHLEADPEMEAMDDEQLSAVVGIGLTRAHDHNASQGWVVMQASTLAAQCAKLHRLINKLGAGESQLEVEDLEGRLAAADAAKGFAGEVEVQRQLALGIIELARALGPEDTDGPESTDDAVAVHVMHISADGMWPTTTDFSVPEGDMHVALVQIGMLYGELRRLRRRLRQAEDARLGTNCDSLALAVSGTPSPTRRNAIDEPR